MSLVACGVAAIVYLVAFALVMTWEGGRGSEGKTNDFPESLLEEWRDFKRRRKTSEYSMT